MLPITIGHWGKWPFRIIPFRLREDKLLTHCRVRGIAKSGKSKHLAHRVTSHILAGHGVMVLDPHLDLGDDILQLLNQEGYFKRPDAYSKLLYIDFSHKERFLPFNWLRQPQFNLYTLSRNFVDVCFRVWPSLADGSAPQFEQIMLSAISVLISCDLPLTALPDLLTDRKFRDFCISRPDIPYAANRFFTKEFDKWGRDQAQMIGSTMRRVFNMTFGDTLMYTLGQRENFLNFTEIINSGTSVLINLHGLDTTTQKLLGCLVTTGMEQAALARANIRTPYFLCIDEFPVFMTKNSEVYEDFLEQARKYKVFLILAHQTNHQLVIDGDESLLKSVGNITFELHFKASHEDAVYEAGRLFAPEIYKVKHDEPHHPMYLPWQEYLLEKAWELKKLWQGECYVRFARENLPWWKKHILKLDSYGIRKIKAVKVNVISDPEGLQTIKDQYAQMYLKPVKPQTPLRRLPPTPSRQRYELP